MPVWAVGLACTIGALASGLGALPFACGARGVSLMARAAGGGPELANGIAAGVMIAASYDMVGEARRDERGAADAVLGLALGAVFIVVSQHCLGDAHDEAILSLIGTEEAAPRRAQPDDDAAERGGGEADALERRAAPRSPLPPPSPERRASAAAARGARRSSCGYGRARARRGHRPGHFVRRRTRLAAGRRRRDRDRRAQRAGGPRRLARARRPRRGSARAAALVAIATSLPQPALAVPAFLFAEAFAPVRALGLGFAAGSMLWITFAEILPDALRDAPSDAVATAATSAATLLLALEAVLEAILDDEADPLLGDAAARWHGRLDALEAEAAAIVEPLEAKAAALEAEAALLGPRPSPARASSAVRPSPPRARAPRCSPPAALALRRLGGVLCARAAARPCPLAYDAGRFPDGKFRDLTGGPAAV